MCNHSCLEYSVQVLFKADSQYITMLHCIALHTGHFPLNLWLQCRCSNLFQHHNQCVTHDRMCLSAHQPGYSTISLATAPFLL